ncbi:hypothetical protein LPJ66_005700 [Kickxella alabastrina]|uniref:Uncharacterized protein n=1 Tax=Kickxella alabastrina TaxID=61397 RepID=A0ACC1IHP5_9FUNG|nr:hypothetical protein LPJ66_005700 [Kickxella alabastrina]
MQSFLASFADLNSPDRRAFLYSDLDPHQPESYAEAYAFWSTLLPLACSAQLSPNCAGLLSTPPGASALSLDTGALAQRLSFCGDTPSGLDTIVAEMQRRGDLVSMSEFFEPPLGLRRIAAWALRRVLGPRVYQAVAGSSSTTSTTTTTTSTSTSTSGRLPQWMVVPQLVEAAMRRVMDIQYARPTGGSLADNLMSLEEFRLRFAPMTALDADILIKRLRDLHYITTATIHGGGSPNILIKFAAHRHAQAVAVSEADRGVYQVSSTQRMLSQQVDQLQERVDQLDLQVRQSLARNHRNLALSNLRLRRHIVGDILPKRLDSLHNVERVLLQLEQTHSDAQILTAFEAGTRALRGLNQGMHVGDVEEVFAEWAQESLRAKEVEDALADGRLDMDADAAGAVDDDELENELEALMASERETDELADALGAVAISSSTRKSPAKGTKVHVESNDHGAALSDDNDDAENEESKQDIQKVAVPAE